MSLALLIVYCDLFYNNAYYSILLKQDKYEYMLFTLYSRGNLKLKFNFENIFIVD